MRTTPWMLDSSTYFMHGFLRSIKDPRILEFGSGGSTVWFSSNGWTTTSIEHDKTWHDRVQSAVDTKLVTLMLAARPYSNVCRRFEDESIDFVLVDGRDRVCCAKEAIRTIKPGGCIMLDNAERPKYAEVHSILNPWEKGVVAGTLEGSYIQSAWWIKPT